MPVFANVLVSLDVIFRWDVRPMSLEEVVDKLKWKGWSVSPEEVGRFLQADPSYLIWPECDGQWVMPARASSRRNLPPGLRPSAPCWDPSAFDAQASKLSVTTVRALSEEDLRTGAELGSVACAVSLARLHGAVNGSSRYLRALLKRKPVISSTALHRLTSDGASREILDAEINRLTEHLGIRRAELKEVLAAEAAFPGPSAEDATTVVLVGMFGAGKSSLIRHVLGTEDAPVPFPAVSPSRTTTALTVIDVLPAEVFTARARFINVALLRRSLEDNIVAATKRLVAGAPDEKVTQALLDHQAQRIRLRHVMGNGALRVPVRGRLERLIRDARVSPQVENIDEVALRRSYHFKRLVDELLRSVQDRVVELGARSGDLRMGSSGWPVEWAARHGGLEPFLRSLSLVAGNGETGVRSGELLTPLIDELHVSGPFPGLRRTAVRLIDTQGLGHTGESDAERRFGEFTRSADALVLVDSAKKAMVGDVRRVLQRMAEIGAQERLYLAMTHMDQLEGGPIADFDDACDWVTAQIDSATNAVASRVDSASAEALRRALIDRTYYLSRLDQLFVEVGDGDHDPAEELDRLLQDLLAAPPNPRSSTTALSLAEWDDVLRSETGSAEYLQQRAV